MNADLQFAQLVADQLSEWAPIRPRRMFGGVGLFREGRMFALVYDGALYFKCNAQNAAAFDAVQAPAFCYHRQGRTIALSYRQAPEAAIDDADDLRGWADHAWRAALSKSHDTN
ncbi:TfoX/Sxy family protein [Algiphilus sp.]|uniref:TfoX/Sxy family protein n=1 Tax=Algiphilus sp. TaxID=1872431 RepID=UPI0032EFBF3A